MPALRRWTGISWATPACHGPDSIKKREFLSIPDNKKAQVAATA